MRIKGLVLFLLFQQLNFHQMSAQLKYITVLLALIVCNQYSIVAQEIKFQKFSVVYSLTPTVGTPLSISQGLSKFQFRVYGENTSAIPSENLPNEFLDDYLVFFIKGWKQVRKAPEFYLDFNFKAPVILEEQAIEIEKPYAVQPPYSEKIYSIKYTMESSCKVTKMDGTVLFEMDLPNDEMEYQFNEQNAARLGYGLSKGTGFQDESLLLTMVKEYRKQMLEDLELKAAKFLMMGGRAGRNNIHNAFYFKMFQYDSKDVFELGLFNEVEGTPLENLNLTKANNAALEYYNDISSNYMSWKDKKDKITEAIVIWAKAMDYVNNLEDFPMRKETLDALAYNMSVGFAYLNNFEMAEVAIKVLNTDEAYGKGIGSNVRKERMLERGDKFVRDFISHRRIVAKLRNWDKIEIGI